MSLSTEHKRYAKISVATVATLMAGYALYKFWRGAKKPLGQEEFYDGGEDYIYYSIINRTNEFTGLGEYPQLIEDVCPLSGRKYRRGNPKDDLEPVKLRNEIMWKHVREHMPKDGKKLRVLELGSGRGSLSRFLAMKLKEIGRLEVMVALNISKNENDHNLQEARKVGLSTAEFQVRHENFDDLSGLEDESYDLIVSNDALVHASDHTMIGKEIARLLSKGGVTIFSDVLACKGVDPSTQLQEIVKRLHLATLPSLEIYDTSLRGAGLTKVLLKGDQGHNIVGHFGMQLYTASVYRREQLLGPNGVSKQFLEDKIKGINAWIDCGQNKLIEQGWFIYKK